jgi:hypothetical protein
VTTAPLASSTGPAESSGLRWAGWGLLSVYFVALLFTLLVRLEVASVLALLLGPWAGHAYGHAGCTMAAAWPAASRIALGLLPLVALIAWIGRGRRLPAVPLLLWFVAWIALAWLSAVNSTS